MDKITRDDAKQPKVYKFVQTTIVEYKTNLTGRNFHSKWLDIESDGTIRVKANQNGYAWDGCSPKYRCLDLLIGTPDGAIDFATRKPITYFGSLVHDAIYQYKEEVPISREEADKLFYSILKSKNFFWSKVYYICVRLFGGMYGKFNQQTIATEPVKILNIYNFLTK